MEQRPGRPVIVELGNDGEMHPYDFASASEVRRFLVPDLDGEIVQVTLWSAHGIPATRLAA